MLIVSADQGRPDVQVAVNAFCSRSGGNSTSRGAGVTAATRRVSVGVVTTCADRVRPSGSEPHRVKACIAHRQTQPDRTPGQRGDTTAGFPVDRPFDLIPDGLDRIRQGVAREGRATFVLDLHAEAAGRGGGDRIRA